MSASPAANPEPRHDIVGTGRAHPPHPGTRQRRLIHVAPKHIWDVYPVAFFFFVLDGLPDCLSAGRTSMGRARC